MVGIRLQGLRAAARALEMKKGARRPFHGNFELYRGDDAGAFQAPRTVGRPYVADGGRSPDLRGRGGSFGQELARVEHAAVFPDLEVHVGAGGTTG